MSVTPDFSHPDFHRAQRLPDLDTFLAMSHQPNTIIFDSRSDFRYGRKHLAGAKHLAFSDFTAANLEKLIPDRNTRILIYCNNNFDGDPVDFATKMLPGDPPPARETQILSNRKPILLALNIPTYINLYGQGYRNVYELDELVGIGDPRVKFEGTVVGKQALRLPAQSVISRGCGHAAKAIRSILANVLRPPRSAPRAERYA